MFEKLQPGTKVITPNGRQATIYKELPRAAGSIKAAWKEEQFDRTPYSVQFADGSFSFVLGGEVRQGDSEDYSAGEDD